MPLNKETNAKNFQFLYAFKEQFLFNENYVDNYLPSINHSS